MGVSGAQGILAPLEGDGKQQSCQQICAQLGMPRLITGLKAKIREKGAAEGPLLTFFAHGVLEIVRTLFLARYTPQYEH
jgi:hypothetical protein